MPNRYSPKGTTVAKVSSMIDGLKTTKRSRTAHQHVLSMLRPAILDGSITAGTRLVQTEIAEMFEVSTTPVREALRDLATEGLVFFDPHHGATVRTLTVEEVQEIYKLRMVLEPLMIQKVISSITKDRLLSAKKLIDAMDHEKDPLTWSRLNHQFHSSLSDPADNSKLTGFVNNLRDCSSVYVSLSLHVRPDQMKEANYDHQNLVELYAQKNEKECIAVTLHHLEATLQAIEAVYPFPNTTLNGSGPSEFAQILS